MSWNQGSATNSTTSMTTSFSSATATSYSSQTANASTSLFTGWFKNDIPFAASFPAGQYLVGVMGSSASATGTGLSIITVAAPSWLGTMGMISYPNGPSGASAIRLVGVASAAGTNPFPGVGSTSSAASALPATIAWNSLSTATTTSGPGNVRPWFALGFL